MVINLIFDFLDQFVVVLSVGLDEDVLGLLGDFGFVFQFKFVYRNSSLVESCGSGI